MLGFHLFFGVTTVGSLSIFADPVGEVHFATSALNMEMIRLNIKEAGNPVSFLKGSDAIEPGRLIDENQHRVYLTKDFYLGKYEVTQAEYEAVMRGNDEGYEARPSNFSKTETRPVESISWHEANYFVHLLNQKEKSSGRLSDHWKYSLPTEAEWEFACRAGTSTAFHTGSQITKDQANFLSNESNHTTAVGMFEPNEWGFYDMHGNVKEWCSDWYEQDSEGELVDPSGGIYFLDSFGNYRNPNDFFYFKSSDIFHSSASAFPKKVCKGGAFDSTENGLRSARRYAQLAENKLINLGFRLALRKEESNATLEKSLTNNVVSFQSGNFYQFEVCWEDAPSETILQSSNQEIGALLEMTDQNFSDQFSVRTIYSKENSTVSRPSSDGYEYVGTLAYQINATLLDSNGQESSFVSEVTQDEYKQFRNQSEPSLINSSSSYLNASNYSYQSSTVGFIHYRDSSFSTKFAQYLEYGNFLGNSSGWMRTDWFGHYYADSFPWIFHENLGWVYVSQEKADNAWLYRENLGWAWATSVEWWQDLPGSGSNESFEFPFLYRYGEDENDTKAWTYLNRHVVSTTLYDFEEAEWFLLDQPYDINISILPAAGGAVTGTGQYYRWQNVSLQAIANPNYQFLRWDGIEPSSSKNEFFAKTSKSIQAVFLPLVSTNLSPAQRVHAYREILNGMPGLSAQQKEWALSELIFYGRSSIAGIP